MRLTSAAASVRGPSHVAEGTHCEDAWRAHADEHGALFVVADGVGSCPSARHGAVTAVRAARAAWRHWAPSTAGTVDDLVRLVEVLWRLGLDGVAPSDAATTCLVCALRADGSGVVAQLGDGFVGVLRGDALDTLEVDRAGFASQTHCLGGVHALRDWQRRSIDPLSPGDVLMLATDGVADDLVPERRAAFVRWAHDEARRARRPARRLAAMLKSWPVPRHLDDKTLLIAWREA